jgi:hypothetical protein
VFDYGEHTGDTPSEDVAWPVRLDPFSSFRAGFDQRCYRLCSRVLAFHRFTALGASPVLVRSTALAHTPSPAFTTLSSVTHLGHDGPTTASLPAMQFTYQPPELDDTVRFVSGTDDLPHGLDLSRFQWVDLDGEGLSGLLGEHGGAWWYKPSLGAGALAPVRKLPHRPSVPLGAGRLMDLDGDGKLEFVRFDGGAAGWFPRDDGAFGTLRRFRDVPTQRLDDPSARLLDVDGDGIADLLVTEERVFRWYPSKGKEGFEPSRTALKALDDNLGPTVMFQGGDETLLLADMTGDGLTDLVRVRNGAVVYWPNVSSA